MSATMYDVATNFTPAEALISRLEERSVAAAASAARMAAEAMAPVLADAIKSETPVGVSDAHLRDTGGFEIASDGDTTAVRLYQDKRVGDKQWALAPLLRDGHRIIAWGHDTGRTSVPNDYPLRARDKAVPELELAAQAAAEATVATLLENL